MENLSSAAAQGEQAYEATSPTVPMGTTSPERTLASGHSRTRSVITLQVKASYMQGTSTLLLWGPSLALSGSPPLTKGLGIRREQEAEGTRHARRLFSKPRAY